MTLLEELASFQNLYEAYHECAKRKRSSMGFQKSRFNLGETLVELSEQLRTTAYK